MKIEKNKNKQEQEYIPFSNLNNGDVFHFKEGAGISTHICIDNQKGLYFCCDNDPCSSPFLYSDGLRFNCKVLKNAKLVITE